MGYSFPDKSLAIQLYSLTGGDFLLAEEIWDQIKFQDFSSWRDAWDTIDALMTEDDE